MSLQLTKTSGGPTQLYMRTSDGTIKKVDVDTSRYGEKPKPGSYVLEVTGISDPFQMPKWRKDGEDDDGAMDDCLRFELTIRDHPKRSGQRFQVMTPIKWGPKATFSQVVDAINGEPLKDSSQISEDFFLGKRFGATVGLTESGNPKIINGSPYALDDSADDGDSVWEDA